MACLVIVYSNLSGRKRETLDCIEENTCVREMRFPAWFHREFTPMGYSECDFSLRIASLGLKSDKCRKQSVSGQSISLWR